MWLYIRTYECDEKEGGREVRVERVGGGGGGGEEDEVMVLSVCACMC